MACQEAPQEDLKEDPKEEVKPEINVPAESQAVFSSGISFGGSSAQSATVSFTATDSWSADVADTKSSTWLGVQPAGGAAGAVIMTVSAPANPGVEARSATVTLRCGNVSKSFQVTQAGGAVPVASVTLSKPSLTLMEGESETLTATVSPDNATDKTVSWSSSNPSVATVEEGKVTAMKEGEATITAEAGGKTATCNVTVTSSTVKVEKVTLDNTSLMLEMGTSFTLKATVLPENATDKTVNWSSSDPSVATVSDGLVNGLKEGIATVTAQAGDQSAQCVVTVYYVFGISPEKVSVAGAGENFTVSVHCSGTYQVESRPDWITEESVDENKVHTFKAAANPDQTERSASLVFLDGKGTRLSCTVTQRGRVLDGADGDNEDVTDGDPINW